MAPEEEVLRVSGLDMAVFIRLITFCKLIIREKRASTSSTVPTHVAPHF